MGVFSPKFRWDLTLLVESMKDLIRLIFKMEELSNAILALVKFKEF
jgi:hypothetical protein